MLIIDLVTGATATGTGSAVNINNIPTRGVDVYVGLAQVAISGAATVKLQGRLSSTYGWVDLATFTASGWQEVTLMPEVRYNISEYTSGSVSMSIMVCPK